MRMREIDRFGFLIGLRGAPFGDLESDYDAKDDDDEFQRDGEPVLFADGPGDAVEDHGVSVSSRDKRAITRSRMMMSPRMFRRAELRAEKL